MTSNLAAIAIAIAAVAGSVAAEHTAIAPHPFASTRDRAAVIAQTNVLQQVRDSLKR